MNCVGMLRIRNEAEWIAEVLESIVPMCSRIYILDDHSSDATVDICRSFEQVELFSSPFYGLDESRDKNYLLSRVLEYGIIPDWVLHIDGDEVLLPDGPEKIYRAIDQNPAAAIVRFRVLYAWNDKKTIRTDGVYQYFSRPSMFRLAGQDVWSLAFNETNYGGNLHCWNHPQGLKGTELQAMDVRLLHYGYLTEDIRRRKHAWYSEIDPGNEHEDYYSHIIQGDPGGRPPTHQLMHAGPLRLEPLHL